MAHERRAGQREVAASGREGCGEVENERPRRPKTVGLASDSEKV